MKAITLYIMMLGSMDKIQYFFYRRPLKKLTQTIAILVEFFIQSTAICNNKLVEFP